ncbi:larval cuticle protein 65Ab1 [Drosophila sechellia]|uniref:GM13862 n=1 Tax=Drosophila sechellia TaxID=7238 RepID=B4HUQ9_DROSE|nr:larval cuticle protein 65Ab1 [Drosophila sechellia]EDW50680.1 GM13862 [Drosophila sechellia]
MKFAIVLFALFAVALAAPTDVEILRQDSKVEADNYTYSFGTSDGTSKDEQGELKSIGPDAQAIVARGQFSYTGPDGVVYTVSYVADENGFQPQGSHLPVAV